MKIYLFPNIIYFQGHIHLIRNTHTQPSFFRDKLQQQSAKRSAYPYLPQIMNTSASFHPSPNPYRSDIQEKLEDLKLV
ncbi:MAG: hypothetical protein HQ557_17010 [Bacteroidetes bacterium]|nr:hypothetical protein [Bacteroidota bacterium]